MRRPLRWTLGFLATSLMATALVGAPQLAKAHRPHHDTTYVAPAISSDVSVAVENPAGGGFNTFWHGGQMFIEGRMGERYNLRVTNNTGERIEAVVTVDGRDVVSGDLGDYRKQRGYVIEPYGSVVIEGYRQSLDYVAAFRFADIRAGYSSRRGTPQHSGVIGVAVFHEDRPRVSRRPVTPTPVRPYDPYYPYGGAREEASGRASSAPSADASASAEAPAPYPSSPATKSASRRVGGGSSSGYAPAPEPNRLGTEYGETRYSSVRETTFKRKHNRRPDSVTTLYYDSRDGLRARGIPVDPPPYYYSPPYNPAPAPFPEVGFAPPPPPRY